MKKFAAIFLLLTGCSTVLAEKQEAPTPMEVASFAIASTEDQLALVTSNPYTLWMVDRDGKRKVRLPSVESVTDIAPEPRVSWSHDAKYVAIQYNAGEDTAMVEVFNANTLASVWTSPVANAQWLKYGHSLIVVPGYALDELQSSPGLVRYDPESRRKQVFGEPFLFAGPLETGKNSVVATIVRHESGLPTFSILRVDVETGKTHLVP